MTACGYGGRPFAREFSKQRHIASQHKSRLSILQPRGSRRYRVTNPIDVAHYRIVVGNFDSAAARERLWELFQRRLHARA